MRYYNSNISDMTRSMSVTANQSKLPFFVLQLAIWLQLCITEIFKRLLLLLLQRFSDVLFEFPTACRFWAARTEDHEPTKLSVFFKFFTSLIITSAEGLKCDFIGHQSSYYDVFSK